MKKIISIFLFATLLFSTVGCSSNNEPMTSNESIIMPTFVNTRWGMTPAEAFEALETPTDAWVNVEDELGKSEDNVYKQTTTYKTESFQLYSTMVSVEMTFANTLNLGLVSVKVSHSANDNAHKDIRSKLVTTFGEPQVPQNVKNADERYKWISPKINDVYSEIIWNNGKIVDDFFNENNRLRKETGTEVLIEDRNLTTTGEQYLCFIEDKMGVNPKNIGDQNKFQYFYFDGFYAAILNWDGKSHKD